MKDKSVTFGITMLVAADTVSACCVNFEIYVGKKLQLSTEHLDSHQGLSLNSQNS
jgi:hypothetical protein